jgi:hypothetical protein
LFVSWGIKARERADNQINDKIFEFHINFLERGKISKRVNKGRLRKKIMFLKASSPY